MAELAVHPAPAAARFVLDPLQDGLLERFALGMARRGICLSRTLMCSDPHYAVVQLAQAQTLADPELDRLAVALIQAFQTQRSGLPSVH